MPRDIVDVDDAGKTGILVVLGNVILTPLYWVDPNLGLAASIIFTGFFLSSAHEVGRNRPTESRVSNLSTFFGARANDRRAEVENPAANITSGGQIIFDTLFQQNNGHRNN